MEVQTPFKCPNGHAYYPNQGGVAGCPVCRLTLDSVPGGINFDQAGTPLDESPFLTSGTPHEAVVKACTRALEETDRDIIVAEGPVASRTKVFADRQRRALETWFPRNHPECSGRMRLGTRTRSRGGVEVRVIFVRYEPEWLDAEAKG